MKKTVKIVTCILCAVLVLASMMPSASALTPTYTPSSSYQNGKYYTNLKNVTLTGDQRTDIVAVAKSQVGYTEGNKSSQLSGTTGGSGDYTEYGYWYGTQDMWCAMFVSWCANQAGVSTSVVPKHSYTVTGLNKFIDWGRAYTRSQVANGVYTPQPGDIIYFKTNRNNAKTNHVGIVTGYSNSTVYTIEGNSSKKVAECSYKITNTEIVYICSPDYSSSGLSSFLDIPTGDCFPACPSSCTTITQGLNSIGVDSSYSYRKQIAAANNIANYSGTAAQNTQMLNLLKAGKLLKPGSSGTSSSSVSYFPACASSYTSIVSALKSVGADSSYSYRKQIAAANNIANYSGTAAQNTQMLNLLKAGKLVRP